jgi:L-fucose isomerase-like protein
VSIYEEPVAAFVGFGEVNSPRELIEKKCREAAQAVERGGVKLVYVDPVSDDPQGNDIVRALKALSAGDFDFIIVCIAGWIPTHAVISVIDRFAYKPMLLWGLAGHYQDGRLITTAAQAGTTALRKVMEDMRYNFAYVYETPGTPLKVQEVVRFAKAARTARMLRSSRIGMMGYRDMNLYTTIFDATSLKRVTGVEIEVFEMLEMVQKLKSLKAEEIDRVVERMKQGWEFEKTPDEELLRTYAQYYLALQEKISERGYQAISLIDVDGMKKLLGLPPAPLFMLIGEELKLCTIPENDSLGAVTQLMVRYLTSQIAPYMEFYEFLEDNRLLLGVPDFVPSEVVDGKVRVIPTGFGGFNEGLLNVSKVKTGKVTLCRLLPKGEEYSMHLVTGEAFPPRTWEEAGWKPPAPQLPSLEVQIDTPLEDFARKVGSQHYILSYGDHRALLCTLCTMLGIQVI